MKDATVPVRLDALLQFQYEYWLTWENWVRSSRDPVSSARKQGMERVAKILQIPLTANGHLILDTEDWDLNGTGWSCENLRLKEKLSGS